MIESKTVRTTTKPVAKLAYWRNGQTAKRAIGCMSRHKAIRKTGKLTIQYTGCAFEQLIGQANMRQYLYMVSRTDRQLTALAAISIIKLIKMFK